MSNSDRGKTYASLDTAEYYYKNSFTFPENVGNEIMKYMKIFDPEKSNKQKFERMIDVGCGSGQSLEMFVPYFDSITGIDISASQIKVAEKYNRHKNVDYRLVQDDVFPVDDNSVDLVNCACSVHLLDFNKFTAECKRVLKPKGCATFCCAIDSYVELMVDSNERPKIDIDRAFKQFVDDYTTLSCHALWKDRFKSLYDRVNFRKEWITDLSFSKEYSSLNDYKKKRYAALGGYRKYMETNPKVDPLEVLANKIKKGFKDGQLKDDWPKIQITFDVPMVIFTKE